jgi:hypothetical protein
MGAEPRPAPPAGVQASGATAEALLLPGCRGCTAAARAGSCGRRRRHGCCTRRWSAATWEAAAWRNGVETRNSMSWGVEEKSVGREIEIKRVIWIGTITNFQSWRYTITIRLFWNIPLQFFVCHKNAIEDVWRHLGPSCRHMRIRIL